MAMPPWPDPLFTSEDIEELLKAGKRQPPFDPDEMARFAEQLNWGFRDAYSLQLEVANNRAPPPAKHKKKLAKLREQACDMIKVLETSNGLQINRSLRYINSTLIDEIGSGGGINIDDAERQLAIYQSLVKFVERIDESLPPKLAEAVLAEHAERYQWNVPQPSTHILWPHRDSARREAVSSFLLAIAHTVLQNLADRAEIAEMLLDSEGNATAGQKPRLFTNHLYSVIGETYIAMFGKPVIAFSPERRKYDADPTSRFFKKFLEILDKQLRGVPDDVSGATEFLRKIIKLKPNTLAQYIAARGRAKPDR